MREFFEGLIFVFKITVKVMFWFGVWVLGLAISLQAIIYFILTPYFEIDQTGVNLVSLLWGFIYGAVTMSWLAMRFIEE